MTALKSGFVGFLIVLGLSGAAQAQGVSPKAKPAAYPDFPGAGIGNTGVGNDLGYYSINGGFGNYGLPGTPPNYGGYGFSGYGPRAILNAYFPPQVAPKPTRTTAPAKSNSRTGPARSAGVQLKPIPLPVRKRVP